MPVATKGEVEDTLRALRAQLAKGLGIAPKPGMAETSAQVVLANAVALAATAATQAAGLRLNERALTQTVGVAESVTAAVAP